MTGTGRQVLPRRVLGRSGIAVSAVGMGCWPIGGPAHNLGLPTGWADVDHAVAVSALERAYELGADLFDTADVYGLGRSERLVRELVRQVPRKSLVLVSKVGYFAGTAPHGYDPGHMRRQLEQSLDNLGTDHLDVYFLHHSNFGSEDRYLDPAIATMRAFRAEGLVRAVGMRGPHRFALDRLTVAPDRRDDKVARFMTLLERVQPDVLAVRDNLLTPNERSAGVFALADRHDIGVLVNKPLAQGLLTGSYRPGRPRPFSEGDHRSRKRWFTPDAVAVIAAGLDELRELIGPDPADLVRVALWACLGRSPRVAVLAGFTSAEQVAMNLGCLADPPADEVVTAARAIMALVQRRLDTGGQVFVDELSDELSVVVNGS